MLARLCIEVFSKTLFGPLVAHIARTKPGARGYWKRVMGQIHFGEEIHKARKKSRTLLAHKKVRRDTNAFKAAESNDFALAKAELAVQMLRGVKYPDHAEQWQKFEQRVGETVRKMVRKHEIEDLWLGHDIYRVSLRCRGESDGIFPVQATFADDGDRSRLYRMVRWRDYDLPRFEQYYAGRRLPRLRWYQDPNGFLASRWEEEDKYGNPECLPKDVWRSFALRGKGISPVCIAQNICSLALYLDNYEMNIIESRLRGRLPFSKHLAASNALMVLSNRVAKGNPVPSGVFGWRVEGMPDRIVRDARGSAHIVKYRPCCSDPYEDYWNDNGYEVYSSSSEVSELGTWKSNMQKITTVASRMLGNLVGEYTNPVVGEKIMDRVMPDGSKAGIAMLMTTEMFNPKPSGVPMPVPTSIEGTGDGCGKWVKVRILSPKLVFICPFFSHYLFIFSRFVC